AIMELRVPITYGGIVIMIRIGHSQSPLHDDKTHLQHSLTATGLRVKQICYVMYGLALIFGLLAVTLSGIQHYAHFFKFIGLGLVVLTMVGLIVWMDYRQRQRGVRINLGGPETPPNGDAEERSDSDEKAEAITQQGSKFINSSPGQSRPDSPYDEQLHARFPH